MDKISNGVSDQNQSEPNIDSGEIKKYIRTFQSDAAALQSGTHPDLAPLAPSPVTPAPQTPPPARPTPRSLPPIPYPKPYDAPPSPPPPKAEPRKIAEVRRVVDPAASAIAEIEAYERDLEAAERVAPPPPHPKISVPPLSRASLGDSREVILARLRARAGGAVVPAAPIVKSPPSSIPPQPKVISPPPQTLRVDNSEEAKALAELKERREHARHLVEARLTAAGEASPQMPGAIPSSPSLQSPSERLIGGSPFIGAPETSAPPPPFMFKPPASPSLDTAAPLHTYESDFSVRVQETKASKATILAAEGDHGVSQPQEKSEDPRTRLRNRIYIALGAVFLFGTIGSAYLVTTYYRNNPETVAPAKVVQTPIFVDDRVQVSGTGRELAAALWQAVTAPLPESNVRLLYTGSGTTTKTNLLGDLGLPVPDVVLRNIYAEGSMVGAIHAGDEQSPFFILAVASYRDTFAGMFSWESRITQDLAELFPTYETSTAPPSTSGTTTPGAQPTFLLLGFHDEVIANHDTRVYRDGSGRSILLYGYWNPQTLIIARNEAAFAEIISRFGTSRTAQ